jgi:flavodoxin
MMKILVTYFSQTGNTEKIASAIHQEAAQANDADLKRIDEIDPTTLSGYDLVFVGSPIHAGSLAKETKDFLNQLPELPGIKLAGFVTHSAPTYPQQTMEQMTQPFADAGNAKRMEYQGCFDCQGYLAGFMHEAVQKMQKLDDTQWQEKVSQMTGHPTADDMADARTFARSVLQSIS